MKMFTNFNTYCSHKMFIKFLIFIKLVDFVASRHWNFYKTTTFKFFKVAFKFFKVAD